MRHEHSRLGHQYLSKNKNIESWIIENPFRHTFTNFMLEKVEKLDCLQDVLHRQTKHLDISWLDQNIYSVTQNFSYFRLKTYHHQKLSCKSPALNIRWCKTHPDPRHGELSRPVYYRNHRRSHGRRQHQPHVELDLGAQFSCLWAFPRMNRISY